MSTTPSDDKDDKKDETPIDEITVSPVFETDDIFAALDFSALEDELLQESIPVSDPEEEGEKSEQNVGIDLEPVEQVPEEILQESPEIEEEYVAPPIPKPVQSWKGWIWDHSPKWFTEKLKDLGLEPPLDALNNSSISLGMGTKGAMLLGPPSAGKTTLIAAINRACLIPVESDIDLWWRASGTAEEQQNLTELLDQAIGQILQEGDMTAIKATNDHKKYEFVIEGRLKTSRHYNGAKAFRDMKMAFHDGPGGAMFTLKKNVWETQRSTREEMIKEAKDAYTLIFCFDGTQRNARMMQSSLARVLPLLQNRRKGNYLYPMRIVILLNKIDQVCEKFYMRLADQSDGLLQNHSVTPESVAHSLDPLSMAIECLGYESLKMLRGAMRPDAELAVGLMSTWGFNNQGQALVNSNGTPNILTSANKIPANEFVSQWRPFGIREMLVYLATGREASMLQIVQPEDFNKDSGAPKEHRFHPKGY